MNLLVDSWWYIYSNQGIGFMSPFLFSCQFMSVNLLIYSLKNKPPELPRGFVDERMNHDVQPNKQEHLFVNYVIPTDTKRPPLHQTGAGRPGRPKTTVRTSPSFSHPDYTVGSGITPDRADTARGLRGIAPHHRRSGISPCPEGGFTILLGLLYHKSGRKSSLYDPKPVRRSPQ